MLPSRCPTCRGCPLRRPSKSRLLDTNERRPAQGNAPPPPAPRPDVALAELAPKPPETVSPSLAPCPPCPPLVCVPGPPPRAPLFVSAALTPVSKPASPAARCVRSRDAPSRLTLSSTAAHATAGAGNKDAGSVRVGDKRGSTAARTGDRLIHGRARAAARSARPDARPVRAAVPSGRVGCRDARLAILPDENLVLGAEDGRRHGHNTVARAA